MLSDRIATENERKAKRAEVIEELVANGYGSKASISKWKEQTLYEAYKNFKAKKVAEPERFESQEVQTTSIVKRSSGALRRPATKRKADGDPIVKTDFKMILLEGDQLVHGNFDVEEKPILTQFRDKATYAYQLQQSIQELSLIHI